MKRKRLIARMAWLSALCLSAALTPLMARAVTVTGDIHYGDAIIHVENAETNWIGSDLLLVYTNAGKSASFKLPGLAQARILTIGGGGAGGTMAETIVTGTGGAGGGGAGGFVTGEYTLSANTYIVTVGRGGRNESVTTDSSQGTPGGRTSVATNGVEIVSAEGGGGGGAEGNGGNGASGGGGSLKKVSRNYTQGLGGTGLVGQGCDGGSTEKSKPSGYGAGGGGAGAAATVANAESNPGGDGLTSDITGTTRYYCGGGGGGRHLQTGSDNHPGGQGGGGVGGVYLSIQPGDGLSGFGGGGGGGSCNTYRVGGAGGDGGVYVRISFCLAGPVVPPKSQELTYDGETHVFVTDTPVYKIVTGTGEGKNVGTNTATIKLTDIKLYQWEDGGDPYGPRVVSQIINRATCKIENLQLKSWKTGTPPEETPEPTCTVADYLHGEGEPTYDYCGVNESAYVTEKPTLPGSYFVRATVKDDPAGNYTGAQAYAKFAIYDEPQNVFLDHVEITIPAYKAGELENFPYRLTLAENNPYGFSYARAGMSGEALCVTDAEGNLLSYEVDPWNVKGASTLYVKLPELGAAGGKIILYWNVSPSGTAPAYDPSSVWTSWTKGSAAYEKVVQPTPAFGDVVRDGKVVNYWTAYPAMDKTVWDSGETPGKLVSGGELAHGTIVSNIVNSLTGETLPELPTAEGGVYRITFSCKERDKYETPDYTIDLRIVEHTTYDDLKGDAETLTLGGRVLLVNDDSAAGHAVTDQGYWQTETVKAGRTTLHFNPFWTHEGEHETRTDLPSLLAGTSHWLMQTNVVEGIVRTNILWRLEDAMIGTHAYYDTPIQDTKLCFLPYSATSMQIALYANRTKAATFKTAGMVELRNIMGAAVYSPCYSNGVGTVYFDAVNAWRCEKEEEKGYYKIAVEYATETIDGLPPTDENARGLDISGNVTEFGRIRSWKRCGEILPLKRDNGAQAFTAGAVTDVVALDIEAGGTLNNYYRLCAKIEARGYVRFRIIRESVYPGKSTDTYALIALDNILVSYPRNSAAVMTRGTYDGTRTGKQVLGQEGAMLPRLPSIGDANIRGRGKPTVWSNGAMEADTNAFIQLSRLHYRWRYLEQLSNDWQSVDLRPMDGFVSERSLVYPEGQPGDIEYWYETFTHMPFYSYYDYSGTGAGLKGADGAALYSEEQAVVTNRIDMVPVGGSLPSRGTNWFVRLREGQSEYKDFKVFVKTSAEAVPQEVRLDLAGDHVWRGVYRTPEALADGLYVRFESVQGRQTDDPEAEETRFLYRLRGDVTALPATTSLVGGGEDIWTRVACDALTGYLLFQVEDSTRAVSIVHADYQNFNSWSDANKKDGKGFFVGTSTDLSQASGSGAGTRTYEELMDWWRLSTRTNQYWTESFPATAAEMGQGGAWEVFKPFVEPRNSPNTAFTVGPGQWVTGNYRDTGSGMALQMQGQGKGYIQYVKSANAPRGLESVSFKARLGQAVTFNDFSYYSGDDCLTMTNYTFVTRAAYDLTGRKSFSGNASLSVVAFYKPGVGAYELRVEQEDATYKAGTTEVTGPGNKQRLTLYRWRYDAAKGAMVATKLGSRVSNSTTAKTLTTTSETGSYGALFIDVLSTAKKNGVTYVRAGLTLSVRSADSKVDDSASWVWYNDTDDTARLKSGSYGVCLANCPGRFVDPRVFVGGHPAYPDVVKTTDVGFKYHDSKTFKFPTVGERSCYNEICKDEEWAVMPWRMAVYAKSAALFGFEAEPFAQPLNIYTAPAGSTAWTLVATTNIVNFGDTAGNVRIPLWTKEDCAVRLAPGGDDETARNDLVIDDLELAQWRGESYNDIEGRKYFPDVQSASPTNFVFTQSWIATNLYKATVCQLNARRSLESVPTSVRSPLMDGENDRGVGLGMFTFSYENAQPNVNLLLQIATNRIDSSSLPSVTESLSAYDWTTVTNFSFSTLPTKGTISHYLGLHGVKGVMRLVMDPAVVAAVATSTDPSAFASIDITGVLCRDEPKLDAASWWGWNLRTTDDPAFMNICDAAAKEIENGQSFGLNNSVTKEVRAEDLEQYPQHLPFLQTPTFPSEVVGEVSFKARKYYQDDPDTRVTLYGARNGLVASDKAWKRLTSWTVSNGTFRAYTYKTSPGDNYCAFRFAVTGVEGVTSTMEDPHPPKPPYRVILDEVYVMEAMRPQLGFRNVAAFRNYLEARVAVSNAFDDAELRLRKAEQPLCKEAWGVQAEIFPTQLADEIDLASAEVRLWWYEKASPWGFANWRDKADAKCAWLAACEETNGFFRSSYFGAPDAVLPQQNSQATVQYMLEVVYRTTAGDACTNWLTQAQWIKPPWYDPVDYNATLGGEDGAFSAFTILDTVSPGWAWINEVNVFGQFYDGWNNSDKPLQFIEIAAPQEADLDRWSIRFLDAQIGDRIVTNTVARFGSDGLSGTKTKGVDIDSKCVFHVIGSPNTKGSLSVEDGRLDGTWQIDSSESQAVTSAGEIKSYHPVSIQLVRPSGVVEHEVTAIGTNYYATSEQRDPNKHVEYLNAHGGHFIYVGMDATGSDGGTIYEWSHSLGVFGGNGETPVLWNNINTMTPGRLNEGQVIDPNYPRPHGTAFVIYSSIKGPHLLQSFAGVEKTADLVTLVYKKGAEEGTNITYYADKWYELGSVSVNGSAVGVTPLGNRTYQLEVGRNVSNDLTVVAEARVNRDLQERYGLTDGNPYRAAIMDWLSASRTMRGPFANPDREEVGLAAFEDWRGTFKTNLTLTTMYWLDMDPTLDDGDLVLRAGFTDFKLDVPQVVSPSLTLYNRRIVMSMMITNRLDATAWAPYVLRGREPGVTSWDYAAPSARWSWTNATFKITGLLLNSDDWQKAPRDRWLPLRWFVFAGESVADTIRSTSFDENFSSVIDITDPYSATSPGASVGWQAYRNVYPIWHRWDLDDRLRPTTVEVLKPANKYSE